jgi:hypothetical protein
MENSLTRAREQKERARRKRKERIEERVKSAQIQRM